MRNRISMHTHRVKLCLTASLLAIGLVGCGSTDWGLPYRATIQQGNWITAEQVAQLESGMSRDQVRFLLGTPTLQDAFHADRWDYPYYNQPGYGADELRKFTVWFDHDQLVRWSGDEQPDRQPFQKADSGKDSVDAAQADRADKAGQQSASPGLNNAASPGTTNPVAAPQITIEPDTGAASDTGDQP